MKKPKITYELVDEQSNCFISYNIDDDKYIDEIKRDYELCLKAQKEKNRVELLLKTLSIEKQASSAQQIQTIYSILRSTRDRLRMNLSFGEIRLRSRQNKDNATLVLLFIEIKEFLKNGQDQNSNRIVKNKRELEFDELKVQANQEIEYNSSDILDYAKKKVQGHRNKNLSTFNAQLQSMFQKQAYFSARVDDENQENLFYQGIASQLEREVQKQSRLDSVYVEDQKPNQKKIIMQSMELASSNFRLDVMEVQDQQLKQKAEKLRQLMKNASEQVFKKKFGNSLVKIKRVRQQNLVTYQQKLQVQLKQKMQEKLQSMKQTDKTDTNNKVSQQTFRTKSFSRSDIQRQEELELNSLNTQQTLPKMDQSPSSSLKQNTRSEFYRYESLDQIAYKSFKAGQSTKSLHRVSLLELPAKKLMQSSQVIQQSYKRNCSIQPPSFVDSIKKINQQLIVAANVQYKTFNEERNDIKMKINSYRLDVNQEMEKVFDKHELYRRVDS